MPPRSRRDELLADIAARLRRVCPDMPDDHFDAMVQDIARITLKYEGHATPTGPEARRFIERDRDEDRPR